MPTTILAGNKALLFNTVKNCAQFVSARMRDKGEIAIDFGIVRQEGTPTSAIDLADAFLMLASRLNSGDRARLGQTHHFANTEIASWYDHAVVVQKLPSTGPKVCAIAAEDWQTAAPRTAYSALDTAHFTHECSHDIPTRRASVGIIVARLNKKDVYG